MLVIDDNKFKLARMQETLLKVSGLNREENLNNYKKTVAEIDTKAFADILEEIKNLNEHNHSLESELEFLQKIKTTYDQLLELQLSFKRVCELYGDKDLKLSDLSQLNIEYIENRISAINGYLTNLKNIETNKARLQELNEQLVAEEKKKELLDSRLQNLEEVLRYNFINAEGRIVTDNSQNISIISEYRKLDLDFEQLLTESTTINKLLSKFEDARNESEATLKATQLCYELAPNSENRLILDENYKGVLKAKYRLIMIQILELLSQNYNSYDLCKSKREKLLHLIEDRKKCLKFLGIHISIDPFDRTKVIDQLNGLLSMTDNSKTINTIRKEIAELTARIEEMSVQNSNYLISLSNTRNLIESKIGLSDIDITAIELPVDEPVVKKEIAKNQVVGIREIPNTLNMRRVIEKTTHVVKRVYKMMNGNLHKKEQPKETLVPELIVVPSTSNETKIEVPEPVILEFPPSINITTEKVGNSEENSEEIKDKEEELEIQEETQPVVDFGDMFETVNPFEEPVLFTDKTDNFLQEFPEVSDDLTESQPIEISHKIDNNQESKLGSSVEEMNDAFWPTQEIVREKKENDDSYNLSFDDQIQMLILPENDREKVRKKVA